MDITKKVPHSAGIEFLLDSTPPEHAYTQRWVYLLTGTCSSMFIDGLFTTARKQDQLAVHQLMDNENVVHINNEILFSHKGKWNQEIWGKWMALKKLYWVRWPGPRRSPHFALHRWILSPDYWVRGPWYQLIRFCSATINWWIHEEGWLFGSIISPLRILFATRGSFRYIVM